VSPAVGEPFDDFNVTLRELRDARGLTQEQVAEAAGTSQSHYSKIELGLVSPTIRTVRKIAHALDVDPMDLLRGEANP
jgi:transcriptional regulator with XRE-family HTH domain